MWPLRLAFVLLWAGVIFALSSLSNPPGETSAEWPSYVAHLTEYAVLAFLVVRWAAAAFPGAPLSVLLLVAWVACAAYGASDEFHQSFVPERDASPVDWAVDALGSAFGLALWRLMVWLPGTRRTLS